MNKMGRRTFLKGVGATAALVAGETAAGKFTRTGAAYGSTGKNPEIYCTTQGTGIDRASFDFYTNHKSRLVAAGPGASEREAVFEISVNPISDSDKPIHLTASQVSGPRGFSIQLNTGRVTLNKNGKDFECRITAPQGVAENTEALFKVSGQRDGETQELFLKVSVLTAAPRWKMGQS
jgi:hypothetical protein